MGIEQNSYEKDVRYEFGIFLVYFNDNCIQCLNAFEACDTNFRFKARIFEFWVPYYFKNKHRLKISTS